MSQERTEFIEPSDDDFVCLNCHDEGCDYCDGTHKGDDWDEDDDDEGQPSEYDEWQDFMGGDDDPADYCESL